MNIEREIDKLGLVVQKGEEILNYSYKQFSEEHSNIPDELKVAILLYGQVIENIKGVYILLKNSSERCALSITRDLIENTLYLMFIMNKKYFEKRALSYYYSSLKDSLSYEEMLLSNHEKGMKIRGYINKELSDQSFEGVKQRRDSLKKKLKEKRFNEIKNEWKRVKVEKMKEKNKKSYFPKWYEVFEGAENIRQLAISCDFVVEYDMLYGPYSRQVHSTNAMEYYGGINQVSQDTLLATRSFGLAAIKYYIDFFLPELDEEYADWYIKEIDPDILIRLADKL
ncbi:hypothetical protein CN454_04965 [Bacillus cereus]|uniref:DUF5677 domain-containing protein n=1 Tax=Bacillus cereus TaxID=1396 RepID=UPI000BFA76C0|nr:DUF5677 domain-containing protein [Bacillus cereus]PEQ78180.1 hypothetical protein CN482_27340 [Bacillus cereus]PES08213.1 hypothetical protein CN501_27835 [Bacillus cereus]PEX15983.1 hypothetical protein CN454_04965 [Bacillus cereus]PGY80090.1 hypothetical protein COE36_29585 [Bacillus cereus]